MKRIVLVFGLIAGALASLQMWLLVSVVNSGAIDFDKGAFWGYTTMIIALSMVFFGVRSYRDNNGGKITFFKALQVGIMISLLAAVCYAVSWEVYCRTVGADEFLQKYTVYYLDKMRTDGASAEEIEKARVESEQFMEMYKNVFVRFGFSLIEIMPVGLVVTLVSAALLRKREMLPAPGELS